MVAVFTLCSVEPQHPRGVPDSPQVGGGRSGLAFSSSEAAPLLSVLDTGTSWKNLICRKIHMISLVSKTTTKPKNLLHLKAYERNCKTISALFLKNKVNEYSILLICTTL